MKIAIIGAGRTRNGIGQYIAKYFHRHGAPVAAVVGSTDESAHRAAENLTRYGINAGAFSDFDSMADRCNPDAVVIALPAHFHRDYIIRSIEAGLHVFCEKPFVWPPASDDELEERIFRPAKEKNITLAMNSQWPFALPSYHKLCGPVSEKGGHTFDIEMQPASAGLDMIPDAVPHVLSLLYCMFGAGTIDEVEAKFESAAALIRFCYKTGRSRCTTTVTLTRKDEQPRHFSFAFDGKKINRVIDCDSYAVYFSCSTGCTRVPDPLELSVCDFTASIKSNTRPRIDIDHIRCNNALLHEIFTRAPAADTQI